MADVAEMRNLEVRYSFLPAHERRDRLTAIVDVLPAKKWASG